MKQGTGNSKMGDMKREPRSHAMNPKAVAEMGLAQGNHAMEKSFVRKVETMHQGRGYEAPMSGSTIHHSGSQGKHK